MGAAGRRPDKKTRFAGCIGSTAAVSTAAGVTLHALNSVGRTMADCLAGMTSFPRTADDPDPLSVRRHRMSKHKRERADKHFRGTRCVPDAQQKNFL